jgi:hypothetical protein
MKSQICAGLLLIFVTISPKTDASPQSSAECYIKMIDTRAVVDCQDTISDVARSQSRGYLENFEMNKFYDLESDFMMAEGNIRERGHFNRIKLVNKNKLIYESKTFGLPIELRCEYMDKGPNILFSCRK